MTTEAAGLLRSLHEPAQAFDTALGALAREVEERDATIERLEAQDGGGQ